MKVRKLIEELKGFDPNANVVIGHPDGPNALFVCQLAQNSGNGKFKNTNVFIESNSDVDMVSVLRDFYEETVATVDHDPWDEDEVANELWLRGITAEDIKKNFNSDFADWYSRYCIEHGMSDDEKPYDEGEGVTNEI